MGKMKIYSVGDLREAIKHADDEEALVFDYEDEGQKYELECVGVGSSGGGRITVLWMDRKHKKPGLSYQI